MAETFPRVLLVSEQPMDAQNGFGVTLRTLFSGWPREKLAQLHSSRAASNRSELCQITRYGDIPGNRGRRDGLSFYFGRTPVWRGRFSRWWLRNALGDWRPDVVYSLMYSGWTLAFAAWIAEQCGCPVVAHATDDSLENLALEGGVSIRKLFESTKTRLVISQEMKAEYESRYGLDFDVLHNGAAEEYFAEGPGDSHADQKVFTIRYLGSILPSHHYHAIEDVSAAVKELNKAEVCARFEICGGEWTKQNALPLVDEPSTVYRGAVSGSEGIDLLLKADLLVLPITFDPAHFEYVRLSLPTKLPEYLASGTPVLVYGPAGVAPVELCRKNGVGRVIDKRSIASLLELIQKMIAHPDPYREQAARDRVWAREHVSASIVAEKFRAIIRQSVQSK